MALFGGRARQKERKEQGLPDVHIDGNGGIYVLGEDLMKSPVFKERLAEAAEANVPAASPRTRSDRGSEPDAGG